MINPNICKFVLVTVIDSDRAVYQGYELRINYRDSAPKKLGRRRLYLKYSILNDSYYLSDRG